MEQVKTKELEMAMETLKREDTKENLARLMELVEQYDFLLPAVLPPNTNPRLIKQILDGNGKLVTIPNGVSPNPAVLQDKEGKKFLPLFTSDEQIARGKQKAPLTLCLPFPACMELITKQNQICGIILNPFDQGITLNIDKTKKKDTQQREMKLTEPQLHAMLRQQIEASVLPTALFDRKEELLDDIREREGEVLLELYREVYPEELECPYTAHEFEVMSLNIREDLSILRIIMPEKRLAPGNCPMVLISWNPAQSAIRYFGVVKGNDGEKKHIIEVLGDGSKHDMGEAPPEGSELQFVIDVNGK